MVEKILNYFKKRPGLLALSIILLVITIVNIKPDFYLMGWDNYSSYFNLKTNIFRTFFATWREYRGLGIPSDSESTDLFRQLFFLILSPFVKENLLDQVFSLFSFNFGVIMVYLLSIKLFKEIFHDNQGKLDLLGAISGFFYIFNLNTLATFYFPMIMYINRFYTVPLLFYIFLNLIQEKNTWKKIFHFLLLITFSSGAYMTATVFITVFISLVIFLFFQSQNLKKIFIFLIFFIALNSFWLLPFINYTINKSNIVYQAPTFIDANEIQLNKPASFYSLFKQLILYPNFFDTNVTSFNGSQTSGIHPLGNLINKFPYNFVLTIFPLVYLCGSIFLLINYKKYKKFLWIPLTIFLYLFLSLKAFSPLGFVYVFMEKNLPFFGSLFRFGDTKFHYFIGFAGSLSAGFFITKISERLNKKNALLVILTIIIISIIAYSSYFGGHFFGFFDLNKLPDAYFEIAKIINQDKGDYRVLHLPFNQDRYWRSYNWGYLGSSFFHFLINKPLLEKTFEPASQENVELNQEIYEKISKKSDDLYLLLKKTGVKYIIFDETVSPQMTSKGIGAWGTYNFYDSQEAINKLESEGLISEISSIDVDVNDYLKNYEIVFPLNDEDLNLINKTPIYKISLYQLKDPDHKFKLIESHRFTDPKLTAINSDPEIDTLQDQNDSFESNPFKRKDLEFTVSNGKVETNIDNFNFVKDKNYTISTLTKNLREPQTTIEIYGRVDADNLHIDFYNNLFPDITIENQKLSSKVKIKEVSIPLEKINDSLLVTDYLDYYLANWNKALPYRLISGLRIKIGKDIIPFPLEINTQETYVGTIVLNQGLTNIKILKENSETSVNLDNLQLTDDPNCFSDKLKDYSSVIDNTMGFRIESKNGSSCFTTALNEYIDSQSGHIEAKLNYQSQSSDLDSKYIDFKSQSKPVLSKSIRNFDKPSYLLVCLKDRNIDDCFNIHQILNLTSGIVIIPSNKEINAFNPELFFALKNTGYQSQTLTINSLIIKRFETVIEDNLSVKVEESEFNFIVDKPQRLKLSFNLPSNYYSFYQNVKDGFNVSNGICAQPNSYRTFRKTDKLISYFERCDNNFFQSLDFHSNNSYIWSVDYNLGSGKFPRFNLGDDFNKYSNQILSLNQGYPKIKGFKEFQNPEFFSSYQNTLNQISNLSLRSTNIVLTSNQTVDDQKKKNFMIAHDSENEGMSVYDNFNVIQIPNTWSDLSIVPEFSSEIRYLLGSIIEYKKILPSLWNINFDGYVKDHILLFNEGYDKQWGLYDNVFDLLIGKQTENHYKCNNYANCFEINSNNTQYFVFYSPEKLNVLGWVLTLLIIFFGKRIVSN